MTEIARYKICSEEWCNFKMYSSRCGKFFTSACHRSVRRFEKEDFVKDYFNLLSQHEISVPTTVFVETTLSVQADEVLKNAEKAVVLIPNASECHIMVGKADCILKVVAENMDDFARI